MTRAEKRATYLALVALLGCHWTRRTGRLAERLAVDLGYPKPRQGMTFDEAAEPAVFEIESEVAF